MNKTKIADIKVTQRIRKEIGKIDELATNIQRFGLLNPITVMKEENGELRLLAGLRRLRAVESLGWIEIAVHTVAPTDAEDALRIEISENEQREPFTFSEKMDFARLLEEIEQAKAKERMAIGGKGGMGEGKDHGPYLSGKQSRDAIGEKIGISGRQYDRAKYIVENAPPEIIEQLDNDERAIRTTYDELRAKERNEKPPVIDKVVIVNDEKPPVAADEVLDNGKPCGANGTDETQTDENHPPPVFIDESKHLRPTPRILKPLSKEDEDVQRRISEFNALPPTKKIEILQEQLRKERARAAEAESELKRERELHHNTKYHSQLSISNLEGQVAELTTKVAELAKALGLDTETA